MLEVIAESSKLEVGFSWSIGRKNTKERERKERRRKKKQKEKKKKNVRLYIIERLRCLVVR